jgi:hypothetical protein
MDEIASKPTRACLSPAELRKLPPAQRDSVLAEAAKLAEHDYRNIAELTDFEAFELEEFEGAD